MRWVIPIGKLPIGKFAPESAGDHAWAEQVYFSLLGTSAMRTIWIILITIINIIIIIIIIITSVV